MIDTRRHAQKAPVRGSARELLLLLRRRPPYTGPVERLAELVNISPARVWHALALLAERELIRATGVGVALVRVTVTRAGANTRL
jgi:DNA-binding Lrp family transcriptional regulator